MPSFVNTEVSESAAKTLRVTGCGVAVAAGLELPHALAASSNISSRGTSVNSAPVRPGRSDRSRAEDEETEVKGEDDANHVGRARMSSIPLLLLPGGVLSLARSVVRQCLLALIQPGLYGFELAQAEL